MRKLPLSVYIIALNEADRIAGAIKSVISWVDEVIVVDSGSDDKTQDVARAAGATVIFHGFEGYGQQKRFAEEQCKHSWVLNIDADEVVSDALQQEIAALFHREEHMQHGYYIKVVESLPGVKRSRWVRYYMINCIRLYHLQYGRYKDHTVHDRVEMTSSQLGQLQAVIEHYSSRSIAHSIEKLNRYSTMQAKAMQQSRKRLTRIRVYTEFPVNFIKSYIIRLYCLQGHQGFIYSVLYAFSRFTRVAKYFETKDPGSGYL